MPDMNGNSQNTVKKKSLGRGLGSLLGQPADEPLEKVPAPARPMTPAAAPTAKIDETAQVWRLSIDKLVANKYQPRQEFENGALQELANSIKVHGILQPIVARRLSENQFEIIAGERRWRAAQLAGLHEVPVLLRKAGEQDSLELAIIENIQRHDLNPMEEAEAFQQLMTDYHLTQQQVAEKVGKERATVANCLRLLVLPQTVKKFVKEGAISSGHAKALLSIENPQDQTKVAQQIVSEQLSVRATEKLVARFKKNPKSAGADENRLDLDVTRRLIEGLSSDLQRTLGTKVTIDYTAGKGKIAVYFYSDDELTALVDRMRTGWERSKS